MKNFKILHPVGGMLNPRMARGLYEYEEVYTLSCNSLEEAFRLSQNDFSEEYASLGKRSTSVGDIIQLDKDYYMVSGTGFVNVPDTVATFIDWGNHLRTDYDE